jgi:methionine-rich copper-binding protein CopC
MSVRPLLAACVSAAAIACSICGTPAYAHAVLEKSEPAQRAQLSRAPSAVRLWFNERLEPAFSSATLTDAAGNPVATESARVSAQALKLLELKLPALSPGQYAVRYQVLSVDGHTVTGSFTFGLKGGAAQK